MGGVKMELAGGVTVQQGERRSDQPFRVIIPFGDGEDVFATNVPEEAVTFFALMVRRIMVRRIRSSA